MTFSPEGPYGTIVTGPPVERANAAIILLHGRGQRAQAMLELARQLDLPSVAWLALQAPAGAWYSPKYDGFDPDGDRSVADACTALAEISSRLEAAWVALDRQGIAGFSQGACLASHFMWCGAAKMGFLGSLTGSLPGFELPTAPVEPRFTGLKAIFTGGLNDDWVKAEHVRETAERFRLSGADVGEYIQPIKDHGIGADEIALLRDTLIARFELNPPVPTRGPRHQPLVPQSTPSLTD
nr:carboxylesterase [uncultured bacterium]